LWIACGKPPDLFHRFSTGSRAIKTLLYKGFKKFSTFSTGPTTTIVLNLKRTVEEIFKQRVEYLNYLLHQTGGEW
jgi:hypothetical protein